ncbi:MAG: 16S rRNA (adenine(1518)-N(6)/adenine(1519)-N(6))-dimethyltransferase RsmA [Aquificaceae bacterium]|nr:16S rRNA (adenine(1518)-N(6)/adenine(1519)-N(6))-dimethyltransferase RsmA [Aquificaceae bacterium]MDW8237637.1 16S rRNA (adenine(1518)-N(6)/adenine(1519)-N(6))-dimethyltransferase RsmA [Aquificaceae bacterium]
MRLKKSLGQHILISQGVCQSIARFLNPKEGDILIEIGPGSGNLTAEVLKFNFDKLYLIEIDKEMIQKLSKIEDKRVLIFHADAREFDFCALGEGLRVFGNLPYCSWSAIVINFVAKRACIKDGLFLLQKEVAERLERESSWISVFVKTFFEVRYLMTVPGRFFRPVPKVQSGLIALKKIDGDNLETFGYMKFLKEVFRKPNVKLGNKLSLELLSSLGIEPQKRVHELEVVDFVKIFLMGGQRGALPPRL